MSSPVTTGSERGRVGALNQLSVRDATGADAQVCRSIYRPYVEALPVSFETHLPPVEQMAERIEAAHQRHAWMIIEWDGDPIGYAQAKAWDDRSAYQWSCETGIYLRQDQLHQGAGTVLYRRLLERLTERGYRLAIAQIVPPNPASVRLHERLGFENVGTLRSVGWKHGKWLDVMTMQRPLGSPSGPPTAIS